MKYTRHPQLASLGSSDFVGQRDQSVCKKRIFDNADIDPRRDYGSCQLCFLGGESSPLLG